MPHPRPKFSPPIGQLTFYGRTWVIYDLKGSYLVCDENGYQTTSVPLFDLEEVSVTLKEQMADAERLNF